MVMFVMNIMCLIVAAVLMIVGGLLQFGEYNIRASILPALFSLASNGDGQATLTVIEIAKLTEDYVILLSYSGLIIFVIGSILIVIALVGVMGVLCRSRLVLKIDIVMVTLVFILIVILVVVFMIKRFQIENSVNQSLYKVLVTNYVFHNQTALNTTYSLDYTGIIDLIQARGKCCGSSNASDYATVVNKGNYAMPYTCCVMNNTALFTPLYSNCTISPDTTNSYYLTGCSSVVLAIVQQYSQYAAFSLIALAAVLLVLIIMTLFLLRNFEER